ncbi:MAG: GNAT family N-acetyltransferase [Solirubrobacterales bacterium]
MDRSDWVRLNCGALRDWIVSVSADPPIVLDGLTAGMARAAPARSVFNSVAYDAPAALREHYEEVAAAYAEAGCAWTVWVPEDDAETAAFLEAAGHVLDAQPRAMGMDLGGVEAPDLTSLDWTDEGSWEEACSVNDGAFGLPEGTWLSGLPRPPEGARTYLARLEGSPIGAVVGTDHPGHGGARDCSIWCVATLEAARGRGIATALMARALADAHGRGCATSTLQATRLGRPVYERVGYADFGSIGMWELRPPELASEARRRPPA